MSTTSDRAVVLAGGKGSRLRPYTVILPKPLMPVGDYPILEVIVRQLAGFEFDHITMAVNHEANIIRAFFDDGRQWHVRIDYSLEQTPLSTVAPLTLIDDLPDNFLLMNGDVLSDLNLRQFYDDHVRHERLFTIAAASRRQVVDYGVLQVDDAGVLTGFVEKPKSDYLVSMGIYAVNRRVLELVPAGEKYGFDDLMEAMLTRGVPPQVKRHDGYWLDIGRPDDYLQAADEFAALKHRFLPDD